MELHLGAPPKSWPAFLIQAKNDVKENEKKEKERRKTSDFFAKFVFFVTKKSPTPNEFSLFSEKIRFV